MESIQNLNIIGLGKLLIHNNGKITSIRKRKDGITLEMFLYSIFILYSILFYFKEKDGITLEMLLYNLIIQYFSSACAAISFTLVHLDHNLYIPPSLKWVY